MPPPSASYHHYRLTPAVSYCRPLYTTVTLPTTPYHRQLYITYRLSPTTDCTLLPTASYYRSPRPTAARDFRTYSSAAGVHTHASAHAPLPPPRAHSLTRDGLARNVAQHSRRASTLATRSDHRHALPGVHRANEAVSLAVCLPVACSDVGSNCYPSYA